MAPYGGRAIGCIFANGSSARRALSEGGEAPSGHTEMREPAAVEPRHGNFSSWNASPAGWSIRSIQVFAFPPGRCDVNMSSLPSGDQRGLELSVLGEVYRCGGPP